MEILLLSIVVTRSYKLRHSDTHLTYYAPAWGYSTKTQPTSYSSHKLYFYSTFFGNKTINNGRLMVFSLLLLLLSVSPNTHSNRRGRSYFHIFEVLLFAGSIRREIGNDRKETNKPILRVCVLYVLTHITRTYYLWGWCPILIYYTRVEKSVKPSQTRTRIIEKKEKKNGRKGIIFIGASGYI